MKKNRVFSDRNITAPENNSALVSFVTSKTLFAFDFDGTLAGFKDDPYEVFLAQTVFGELESLFRKAFVVVLSGRSSEDVKKRLPSQVSRIVGNHGAEMQDDPVKRQKCRTKVQTWALQLPAILESLGHNNFRLEEKGVSLTVHFAEMRPNSAEFLRKELSASLRPKARIFDGRRCLNLVCRELHHKGAAALKTLHAERFEKAIYVGDDLTDEDVFNLSDERILTIRVGHTGSTAAEFTLESHKDIMTLLSRINSMLPNRDGL